VWEGAAYREVRRTLTTGAKLAPCARCDDFLDENRRLLSIAKGDPAGENPRRVPTVATFP
jgi:hypothetical protein